MPETLRCVTDCGRHWHEDGTAGSQGHTVTDWKEQPTDVEVAPTPPEPGDPPDLTPTVMIVFRPSPCRHTFIRMPPDAARALAERLLAAAGTAAGTVPAEPRPWPLVRPERR